MQSILNIILGSIAAMAAITFVYYFLIKAVLRFTEIDPDSGLAGVYALGVFIGLMGLVYKISFKNK